MVHINGSIQHYPPVIFEQGEVFNSLINKYQTRYSLIELIAMSDMYTRRESRVVTKDSRVISIQYTQSALDKMMLPESYYIHVHMNCIHELFDKYYKGMV